MSRRVSYLIGSCFDCPFHDDIISDDEQFDSVCKELQVPFSYGALITDKWFPDWCPLESGNG